MVWGGDLQHHGAGFDSPPIHMKRSTWDDAGEFGGASVEPGINSREAKSYSRSPDVAETDDWGLPPLSKEEQQVADCAYECQAMTVPGGRLVHGWPCPWWWNEGKDATPF